ncbi:TetR/AcrR family transcriptional regulator [Planctobacterium marinum]|uniref:TetR/AcrR family transcriptional regulator n=1 Tax=Planctobacterium marinum TaxID=1631968 RepID=UPI001E40536F|nr:TetR/AcrR family transcriptional regulator [Planctobacterium marinum]MCC2605864.1 TetR/AcrR family transcriptional regulator [Planctobacterium marinum]
MARPRTFCEEKVINAAMNAFWQHGYDATSMCDLETATGLKRISIYNAFGDKEGMFLAALDMYHEQGKNLFQIEVPEAGLEGIKLLFEKISSEKNTEEPNHCGCLMVNALLDLNKSSPAVKEKLLRFKQQVYTSFYQALENARNQQLIDASEAELTRKTEYLCGCLWGAIATIRIDQNPCAAKGMVATILDTIQGWKRHQNS